MLTLNHITYSYPKTAHEALADVCGQAGHGIYLLMGENGSGKTTLLKALAGILPGMKGEALLDGTDTASRLPSARILSFFLPDAAAIPARSIRELADIHARLYPSFSPTRFANNLNRFGLTGREHADRLSLGQRQKSWIAYTLALGVDLLLLDEPANGLDISSRKEMRAAMAECVGEEQTVIVSTHTVADLHALYDGVMMMDHGHVVLCAPTWEIASRLSFTAGPIPRRDALYYEQDSGLFHSLSPITVADGDASEPDFALLYSALLSPRRQELLNLFSHKHE